MQIIAEQSEFSTKHRWTTVTCWQQFNEI